MKIFNGEIHFSWHQIFHFGGCSKNASLSSSLATGSLLDNKYTVELSDFAVGGDTAHLCSKSCGR